MMALGNQRAADHDRYLTLIAGLRASSGRFEEAVNTEKAGKPEGPAKN